MSDRTFTCPRHGETILCISGEEAERRGIVNECSGCANDIAIALAADMTPAHRCEELDYLFSIPLTVSFSRVHQLVERLVGRPVWTHEMTRPGLDYLKHEIMSGSVPTMEGVIAKLPADKPVIVVTEPGKNDDL